MYMNDGTLARMRRDEPQSNGWSGSLGRSTLKYDYEETRRARLINDTLPAPAQPGVPSV